MCLISLHKFSRCNSMGFGTVFFLNMLVWRIPNTDKSRENRITNPVHPSTGMTSGQSSYTCSTDSPPPATLKQNSSIISPIDISKCIYERQRFLDT